MGDTAGDPTTAMANPGVRFPPPVIYAIAFLLGIGLHRLDPVDSLPRDWLRPAGIAGWALIAVGLALGISALTGFRRARTSVIPHRAASALVHAGPYRLTRNPMYLGLAVQYTGLALVLDRTWPLIFLPLAILVIHRYVIAREERYLRSRFGEPYAEYLRRVPRWIGMPGRQEQA